MNILLLESAINLNSFSQITTPISLAAFFAALYYLYKRSKDRSNIKMLETANEAERPEIIKGLEMDYPIPIPMNNITYTHEGPFQLIMEQIKNKEAERKRRFFLSLTVCILFFILTLCSIFIPSNSVAFKPKIDLHQKKVDLTAIEKYEKKNQYWVDSSGSINKTFIDLFLKSNEPITTFLTEKVGELKRNKKIQEICFVSAVAGYGKTTLIDEIAKRLFKNDYVKVNLIDDFIKSKTYSNSKTDLAIEDISEAKLIEINQLPNVNFAEFSFLSIINDSKKKIIIIDDLDEIHPQLAYNIIDKAMKYIENTQNTNIIILVGRPEVFNEYMNRPDYKKGFSKNLTLFNLSQIKYSNLGEVRLRIENYNQQLEKNWTNDSINLLSKSLVREMNKSTYLANSFSNLSLSKRIVALFSSNDTIESDIKESLLDDILERGTDKHNRPSKKLLTYNELYMEAWEFVAAKYSNVDDEGFFKVKANDVLDFSYNNKEYKLNVISLLNRSGFIKLKPINDEIRHYKFEPFWLHSFFCQKYNSKCKN